MHSDRQLLNDPRTRKASEQRKYISIHRKPLCKFRRSDKDSEHSKAQSHMDAWDTHIHGMITNITWTLASV
jgi:hypothetical protein